MRKPSYAELKEMAQWAATKRPEATEICKQEGYVFANFADAGPWEKLAFRLYSDLAEIESRVKNLFEEEWKKNDKLP